MPALKVIIVASKFRFRFRGVTGTAKETLRSGGAKNEVVKAGAGFEAWPAGTFSERRRIRRDVGPCRAIGVAKNGESIVVVVVVYSQLAPEIFLIRTKTFRFFEQVVSVQCG